MAPVFHPFVLVVLWIALSLPSTAPIHAAPAESRVPILGWHSIPENQLSLSRFQELAGMGLTHSLMSYSPAGNLKALDFAAAVGVKLFVGDDRFEKPGQALQTAAASYKTHPALAGYLLRDEPSLPAFQELAASRDALRAADPDHWSYVNLLPTYASPAQLGADTYLAHVRRFLLDFRPEVLSFDHYPILEPQHVRADFFQNLAWIRLAALEFNVPFWAFALTCPHRPYPQPTLAHIRFQAWSNFAYGARGLQYFTYWTPQPGTWDFHDAPIRIDGARGPAYELLKEFNLDVQNCASIILSSRVAAVYHTEPLPAGTQPLDASSPFSKIEGGEALVGYHVMPNGRRYALLVNRSLVNAAKFKLTLQKPLSKAAWEHPVSGARLIEAADGMITAALEPGAGIFLHVQ